MQLKQVDTSLADAAEAEWGGFLNENDELPEGPYERAIAWVRSKIGDSEYHGYAIINGTDDGDPKILGFVDISHKLARLRSRYTLKLMSIVVAPHFDVRGKSTEESNTFTRRKKLSQIASGVVISGIDMMHSKGAVELKIYASNQLNLELFELVCAELPADLLANLKLDVDVHGNWLVVRRL